MDRKSRDILIVLFLLAGQIYAQFSLDSIQRLDEVVVSDRQLKKYTTGQKQLRLNDSVINRNLSSLTDVLHFNTPIYFNQNGYGMVSSPSFRGTTAQQTAVIWNGININSQFNGQTDFNTIMSNNASEIIVKPGGGSVVYGTGAIGGSIHLNNKLTFMPQQRHFFQTSYGSFETFDTRYQFQKSTNTTSLSVNFNRNTSENNFPTPNRNLSENTNASFERNSLQASASVKLPHRNTLIHHLWYSYNFRNFPIVRASENPSAYTNEDFRSMLEWESKFNNLSSHLRLVRLLESFTFNQNTNQTSTTTNLATTSIARYDLSYDRNQWLFNLLLEGNSSTASGDNLSEDTRRILTTSLLAKREWNERLTTEISLRKEYVNLYNSPLLYALGGEYQVLKKLQLKTHFSKNFRIPTFNDLFWQGSGNTNLLPETAHQGEIGLLFRQKQWQLGITYFYQDIRDMIRWVPNQSSVWQPINTDHVVAKGIEAEARFQYQLGQVFWQIHTNYTYTSSENQATGNQLRYIPFHKANASMSIQWKQWNFDTQVLYVGEVFTRSSNNPNFTIEDYQLQHLGIHYQLPKYTNFELGLRAYNLWNVNYQSVENLTMPGRSFLLQIQFIY